MLSVPPERPYPVFTVVMHLSPNFWKPARQVGATSVDARADTSSPRAISDVVQLFAATHGSLVAPLPSASRRAPPPRPPLDRLCVKPRLCNVKRARA